MKKHKILLLLLHLLQGRNKRWIGKGVHLRFGTFFVRQRFVQRQPGLPLSRMVNETIADDSPKPAAETARRVAGCASDNPQPDFLIEILGNMTCGTVVMKFADPRRAALIVPAEEEEESDKICGILMPIMVS